MNYICNCKKYYFFDRSYAYWEDRAVTSDEMDIINFLDNKKKIQLRSVLHVGIGNSYFAKKFATRFNITGITISQKEVEAAETMQLLNYKVFLFDKYSIQFKKFLDKNSFDLIIDTNLKSYSCCQESFEFMINNILKSIKPNGMLITSINGMKWFKKLKPKLSFSLKKFFYFKLKETIGNRNNVLSLSELNKLSNKNNVKMTFNKKLCYLKK
jgi:2-polyprenyl-3-methyl-5-hydroxy-6-metoxy-1,4-benzoquinol methylase